MADVSSTGTWMFTLSAAIGAVTLGAAPAEAVTLSSLAPGSAYRYVFTSSGQRDATSTDISVYNAFVTSQASQNAALIGISFKAIGSTLAVNAIDNVSCGAGCDSTPIFTLDGNEVAGSLAQLFSGSLLSTLGVNQSGGKNDAYVFTGSQADGTKSVNTLGGKGNVELGATFFGSQYSIDAGFAQSSVYSANFYGLSGSLLIPGTASVPEPASLVLLGAGLAGFGVVRRRKA